MLKLEAAALQLPCESDSHFTDDHCLIIIQLALRVYGGRSVPLLVTAVTEGPARQQMAPVTVTRGGKVPPVTQVGGVMTSLGMSTDQTSDILTPIILPLIPYP